MITPRGFYSAVLIPDGRVLITGGFTLPATCNQFTASAELYNFTNGKWSSANNMLVARGALAEAALLADGNVLVAGGRSSSGATATAELFNSQTNTWITAGSMKDARTSHTVTTLNDGRVLVVGGRADKVHLASAELYVP